MSVYEALPITAMCVVYDRVGERPRWDESFSCKIRFPDVAQLRFHVIDADSIGSDFIGQFTVPARCLCTGKLALISLHVHFLCICTCKVGGCAWVLTAVYSPL